MERLKDWIQEKSLTLITAVAVVFLMKTWVENIPVPFPAPVVFRMPETGVVHGLFERDADGVWVSSFESFVSEDEACWKAAPVWDLSAQRDWEQRVKLAMACVRLTDTDGVKPDERVKLIFFTD